MDMNRRTFLRGLLTVTAVSIAPVTLGDSGIPRIVGDGIHDDAAGIQAAIDGLPFEANGLVVRGQNEIRFGDGVFRVTDPIRFTKGNRVGVFGAPEFKTRIVADHDSHILSVDAGSDVYGGGFKLEFAEGRGGVGLQYSPVVPDYTININNA